MAPLLHLNHHVHSHIHFPTDTQQQHAHLEVVDDDVAKSDDPEEAAISMGMADNPGMADNLAVVKGSHRVHLVLAGLAHGLLARWMMD